MESLWCRGKLLLLGAFLISRAATGQITFNKTYEFGVLTLCQSVQEIEGGYLLAAYSLNLPQIFLLHLSVCAENGEAINVKTFGNVDEQFKSYHADGVRSNGQITGDDKWVTAWVKEMNGVEKVCIVWSDLNGDTLFTKTFSSPYEDQVNYFKPTYLDIDSEGNIYVAARVRPNQFNSDLYMLKLTPQGNIIWIYNPQTPENELDRVIRAVGEGAVIEDISTNPNKWVFRKRNSPTDTEWETEVSIDGTIRGINEFIVEEDGIVFCTTYPMDTHVLPAAVKVNYSGGMEWFFGAEGEPQSATQNTCGQIEKTQDGGYVLGATEAISLPPNPELNGNYNYDVRLIKLDSNGGLVWDRYYNYITSINDYHTIADLRATSDGGFVFCGHVVDQDLENNGNNGAVIQWGWVVKVDACGCLVPGCDPDCIYPGVEEPANPTDKPQYFVCGPNPAADFLNIYMRQAPEGATLRIHDMAGKELNRFAAGHAGLTHMASVRGWSAGVYALSLEKGGEVLQSLKVVVE